MRKTLYAELAETLRRQISTGQYPVGSVLPLAVGCVPMVILSPKAA